MGRGELARIEEGSNDPFNNIVRVIKSRRLRWASHVARMEVDRSTFKILTGTHTGKIPLGRPRRRWEDNIRMDLKEIRVNTRNWADSAQDRDYWRALVIFPFLHMQFYDQFLIN